MSFGVCRATPSHIRVQHDAQVMVERYSHQNGAHIEAAMDALEAITPDIKECNQNLSHKV